jgi:septal ring factor EnvC (AmiA/AmiB activator)
MSEEIKPEEERTPKEKFVYMLVDVVRAFDNIPSSVLGHTVEECKDRCRTVYKEYRRQIKAHEMVLEERTNELIQKEVFIEGLHQRFDDQATDAAYLEGALKEAHERISEVEMNYNAMKNAYHRLAAQCVPQLRPMVRKQDESDLESVPAVVVRPVSKSMKKRKREWERLSQFKV